MRMSVGFKLALRLNKRRGYTSDVRQKVKRCG